MPRPPIRRLHAAFTLIELMIVVSILGILAGLMTGVIGYVQSSAKRNQCLNNLRQWGGAMSLYLDEHRSRTFPTYKMADGAGAADLWWNALPPYLEKGTVPPFTCASDPAQADETVDVAGEEALQLRSYAINPWVHEARNKPPRTKRLRDSQLSLPSQFVLMFESGQSEGSTNNVDHIDEPLVQESVAGYADRTRHGKNTNVLFADGHAATVVLEEAHLTTQWNPNKDLQGNDL